MTIHTLFTATLLFALSTWSNPTTAPLGHDPNKILLPIGGNAWTTNGANITDAGLEDWDDPQTICTAYIRVTQPGVLKISLLLHPQNSQNRIKVTVSGKGIIQAVGGNAKKEFYMGEWTVTKAGYIPIAIQGISKTGDSFGLLSSIGLSGSALTADASYVKDNKDNYFHWGRRGPSVHLRYNTDQVQDIQWFYSEITVPAGNDVIGSYFMANGFGEGYFGMQVNGDTERRVLFSVWSPFETDDPKAIPEDHKIVLLKKGEQVKTGEFGNEGSGGQSYWVFPWKAGVTYRFLLQGQPIADNCTVYTAYFFAPELNQWKLIASFKRPQTQTYLSDLYSFLENFEPETGNTTRMALYGNQWAADKNGNWTELNTIDYTADNTARKNFRMDYAAGVNQGSFFLRNCGFFDDFVPFGQSFTRVLKSKAPGIDFLKLP